MMAKVLWGKCSLRSNMIHNHVLCECPPCKGSRPFEWYRCVLTDEYLDSVDIDSGGAQAD